MEERLMHIADMLALRPVPAAGVFLTLTRRCPLTCAHCSTNSMMDSEEHAAAIFERFVATFSPSQRPELVWLTGGEPLLRPDLVHHIVEAAHAAGVRVALITGLYFARADGHVIPRLARALAAVDHVVVSQDVFHETQVPRAHAFATVATLVAAGQDVSFQVVGRDAADPYLAEVTGQIRETFHDQVPALVAPLGPVGRARRLMPAARAHRDQEPVALPCTVAAWPVVTFDGRIVSCCQQRIVDGPAPSHLALGTTATTGWPEVAAAVRTRVTLRALRTLGPEVVADAAGQELSPDGYCGTCVGLGDRPGTLIAADTLTRRPTFELVESEVLRLQTEGGAEGFARQYGIAAYAHLVNLGRRPVLAAERG
jgi:organic radical activating enzyme